MSMSTSLRFADCRRSTRNILFGGGMFLATLSGNTLGAEAINGAEMLTTIVQNWQRRQQLRGYRYLVAGTHLTPKGSSNQLLSPGDPAGDLPAEDTLSDVKTQYFVDLERNRSCIERDFTVYHVDERRFLREFTIELFDGQRAQIFYPRERNPDHFDGARTEGPWNPDLVFESSSGPAVGRSDLPVLLAHGMVLVSGGSTLGPGKTLRRTLAPETFALYGRAVRDGRECIVLRSQTDRTGTTPSFNEFWVDPQKDSTIVRLVRYIGDSENLQIDMWYEDEESRGYPLTRYTYLENISGESVQTREMHVLEYEPEPVFADSLFYVEPKPGFNVYDWTAKRQYRVGLPGQPDRDLGELRREMAHGARSWARLVFFALNVVALVLILSFVFVFRYRKRSRD